MSASKLRAVDMAVLNLFSCANRITIVDGAERSPENAHKFGMGSTGHGGGLPGPMMNVGSAFISSS